MDLQVLTSGYKLLQGKLWHLVTGICFKGLVHPLVGHQLMVFSVDRGDLSALASTLSHIFSFGFNHVEWMKLLIYPQVSIYLAN